VGLIADLGPGRIGVDTCLFIYYIEEDPRFLPLIEPLFREADAGTRELVTSALTLLEVLVVPYRAGDASLAGQYEQFLTRSRGIRVVDLSRDQLRDAAQLRAATGIKTPDALQFAAAIACGCTAFVTNDRRLPAVRGTRVLQLCDY
jgi:predicted nucleic acid-binding protein